MNHTGRREAARRSGSGKMARKIPGEARKQEQYRPLTTTSSIHYGLPVLSSSGTIGIQYETGDKAVGHVGHVVVLSEPPGPEIKLDAIFIR